MIVKFFNPGKEFKLHKKEYVNNWIKVREDGSLIMRKELENLEKGIAKFVGVKYAVGCNSGTDALLIALKAIGLKPGQKVLVPSHTFVATAQVVAQLGAKPVLYDLYGDLLITPNTAGIIVAHIAGDVAMNMDELVKTFHKKGLFVIEDACQAMGAKFEGKKAGSFGDVGAFSFYPAKVLGSAGDAGMLVTDRKDVYDFSMEYRNHWKSDYSKWGINSRLDNVLASELNIKLKRLPKTLKRREQIAEMYLKGLRNVILPKERPGRIWQDFIIGCSQRDKMYEYLKKQGIETMKNEYPFPIKKCPMSINYEKSTLRLPINEVLTDSEIKYVIKKVNSFNDSSTN